MRLDYTLVWNNVLKWECILSNLKGFCCGMNRKNPTVDFCLSYEILSNNRMNNVIVVLSFKSVKHETQTWNSEQLTVSNWITNIYTERKASTNNSFLFINSLSEQNFGIVWNFNQNLKKFTFLSYWRYTGSNAGSILIIYRVIYRVPKLCPLKVTNFYF